MILTLRTVTFQFFVILLPTPMKKEKIVLEVRILLWWPVERSPRKARQGPWSMLLATSRIQKPMTKNATARGRVFFERSSPMEYPMSAAKPMRKTAIATAIAPAKIKGRRRPKREVQRSLE